MYKAKRPQKDCKKPPGRGLLTTTYFKNKCCKCAAWPI